MLLGDKAYSSRAIRAVLKARRITAVIPDRRYQQEHRRRRGSAGGRPSKFDPVAYKNRNVVERSFALLKQWRGLATRFDKLAIGYRSAAVLFAVLVWIRMQRTRLSGRVVISVIGSTKRGRRGAGSRRGLRRRRPRRNCRPSSRFNSPRAWT
jgi:transposase